MKPVIQILAIGLLSVCNVSAIDFHATIESVWQRYIPGPPPDQITESALRTALEWRTLKGPLPQLSSATPYGIKLKQWDRVISRMGLPLVADDYVSFLHQLQAELARGK